MRKALLSTMLAAMVATPAYAEAGDWLVRLRGIYVAPQDESGGVLPAVPTGSVTVDDAIVPELDFTYFFTNNIAAELILATSPHDIDGAGAISALGEVADTMALPPTLTLQYHFAPDQKVRPYVGAGLNWTIFYSEDSTASLDGALGGPTAVSLDDSFGWAVQAGVDIDITERVFLNLDVKYIDIDTTATLNTGGAINTIDVAIDPIVAGIGFGMRF
ncbi:MAG TPA: OmpW family protein [Parvularculaceae bacterium]|nr:OmpW family protein [Parvularculaceae bacterium]HNS85379.1 OmpW family protein [Parvularculaceae bacterium]